MKKYLALYWKEVRSIAGMGVFLIVMTTVISVIVMLNVTIRWMTLSQEPFLLARYGINFIYSTVFMFPVIFAYSLYEECKLKTHYQLFSLPVHIYSTILYKFLAIVSIGALLSWWILFLFDFRSPFPHYCSKLILFLTQTDISKLNKTQYNLMNLSPISISGVFSLIFDKQFWWNWADYFVKTFVYSSIVCVAFSFMSTVKRQRFITRIVTLLSCLVIYENLYANFRVITYDYFPTSLFRIYFPLLAGLIFLFAGFFLYEKYAEV